MIELELLKRKIKVIAQDAWKADNNNTTVNSMIEFIVVRTAELLYDEFLDEIAVLYSELDDIRKVMLDGEDGRDEKSQRNTKASDEGTKPRANGRVRPTRVNATLGV